MTAVLVAGPSAVLSHRSAAALWGLRPYGGAPEVTVPGTAGRNLVRGPGFVNVDYSLFKDFAFSENKKLQVRFETFNLLNTPHFGNPQGNLGGGADFGRIRRTVGNPRILQFAAKFLF